MFKQATNKLIQNISAKSNQTSGAMLREYATHRVHTPDPTTNSKEGISNNPIFTLFRKKNSIVGQHSEWAYQECKASTCAEYICSSLCDKPKSPEQSIGHFTHSDKKATGQLCNQDLEGEERPQYAHIYKQPHETTSNSRDESNDEKKTEKLHKILTNNNQQDHDDI